MIYSDAPWHFGLEHAGLRSEWLPSDTEESFNCLIQDKRHRKYFQQQGWLEPHAITYKINSYGFRCEEFEGEEPCMIALGCSFTLGTGLPVKDIWPTMLGYSLGLKVYNLGWGGNSADTCFRLAEYWISQLKPALVCMLTPPPTRIELLTDTQNRFKAEVFMPETQSSLVQATDTYLKYWYINDENSRLNNLKNKLAVKELCNQHGVRCMIQDSMDIMSRSREEVGYARDYMHAGPIAHSIIANKFVREYHG
jgi:hypothetical protein